MARVLMLPLVLLVGCGGVAATGEAQMALSGPSTMVAVELLVLGGPVASCARALGEASPLDDSALDIVAHGHFALDGMPKHLMIPTHELLAFFAWGLDAQGDDVGRGCTQVSLDGSATPVNITIMSSSP